MLFLYLWVVTEIPVLSIKHSPAVSLQCCSEKVVACSLVEERKQLHLKAVRMDHNGDSKRLETTPTHLLSICIISTFQTWFGYIHSYSAVAFCLWLLILNPAHKSLIGWLFFQFKKQLLMSTNTRWIWITGHIGDVSADSESGTSLKSMSNHWYSAHRCIMMFSVLLNNIIFSSPAMFPWSVQPWTCLKATPPSGP